MPGWIPKSSLLTDSEPHGHMVLCMVPSGRVSAGVFSRIIFLVLATTSLLPD